MSFGAIMIRFIWGILMISIFVFFSNWKKQYRVFNYLGFFIVLNIITECLARIYQVNGWNNLPLLHIYTLGEFILLSMFYKMLFKKEFKKSHFFKFFIPIVSIIIILNTIFLQEITGFNSYAKTLVQCILIGYALFYFVKIDARIEERNIKEKARLIANSAILIYYSGSLFIFMFSDFFSRYSDGLPSYFWLFNVILNLIFQLIILSAIWMIFKNKKYISL